MPRPLINAGRWYEGVWKQCFREDLWRRWPLQMPHRLISRWAGKLVQCVFVILVSQGWWVEETVSLFEARVSNFMGAEAATGNKRIPIVESTEWAAQGHKRFHPDVIANRKLQPTMTWCSIQIQLNLFSSHVKKTKKKTDSLSPQGFQTSCLKWMSIWQNPCCWPQIRNKKLFMLTVLFL